MKIIFTIVAVWVLVLIVAPILIKALRIYAKRAADFLKERAIEDFEVPLKDEDRGLYRKYYVKRLNDPTGKHDKCFHFVLDLTHDPFAMPAIKAYADACRGRYPILAKELESFRPSRVTK